RGQAAQLPSGKGILEVSNRVPRVAEVQTYGQFAAQGQRGAVIRWDLLPTTMVRKFLKAPYCSRPSTAVMLNFPRSRTPPSVYPFPEQLRGPTDPYRSPREGIYDLPLACPSSNDG